MSDRALAEELARIARRAAELVLSLRAGGLEVELKGPNDPVTQADRAANELLLGALAQSFPGEAVIAEESAPSDPAELARLLAAPRVFFVDPIDGTREFAAGLDEFCVMVGLAEGGRATAGAVVLPSGEALWGAVGAGAWRAGPGGAAEALRPNAEREPRRARMMVSRSHPSPTSEQVAAALGITERIPCGSVGVKVARVATGAAEVYVHGGLGIKKWDLCAPDAVLRAAGGGFTDLHGALHDYASAGLPVKVGLIATNGPLQDAVVRAARG